MEAAFPFLCEFKQRPSVQNDGPAGHSLLSSCHGPPQRTNPCAWGRVQPGSGKSAHEEKDAARAHQGKGGRMHQDCITAGEAQNVLPQRPARRAGRDHKTIAFKFPGEGFGFSTASEPPVRAMPAASKKNGLKAEPAVTRGQRVCPGIHPGSHIAGIRQQCLLLPPVQP